MRNARLSVNRSFFLSPEIDKGKKRPQLSVRINRVFIGCNVDRSQMAYLTKIIDALDSNIEIVKMHKKDLYYGYNQ